MMFSSALFCSAHIQDSSLRPLWTPSTPFVTSKSLKVHLLFLHFRQFVLQGWDLFWPPVLEPILPTSPYSNQAGRPLGLERLNGFANFASAITWEVCWQMLRVDFCMDPPSSAGCLLALSPIPCYVFCSWKPHHHAAVLDYLKYSTASRFLTRGLGFWSLAPDLPSCPSSQPVQL